jgi:hypothetical protein
MSRRDPKCIRVGNEVFLKTQILKKMSEDIHALANQLVVSYSNGFESAEIERIDSMINERAEIISQLTKS